MNLLSLENYPIFAQLQLEEALLRADGEEWCLINDGTTPAIVMGISGKAEELIDTKKAASYPLIKRFSGGGTVFVDEGTIFVTLIRNGKKSSSQILESTKELYMPLIPGFTVRENDYCLGEKKFGGNAQYLQKERWLHHTSFLWSFSEEKMECLTMPKKQPAYREQREHGEFLAKLQDAFSCRKSFVSALKGHLLSVLGAKECALPLEKLALPHRSSTLLLKL